MTMSWRRVWIGLVAVAALIPADAALSAESDWPCIQRRVGSLSMAQMWAGPIPAPGVDWRSDAKVAALAPSLVARRTSLENADAAIQRFAEAAGPDKNRELTLLFAGTFELIDSERKRVIAGIERYSRKQQNLAKQIKETSDELRSGNVPDPRRSELEQKLQWDSRIYDDRNQALTYVCESPVILEQRAFLLAQEIARHLE